MEYPFFTEKVYFSGPEERHLQEFLSHEPQPGKVYTNADGEERLVMDLILPKGIITGLTTYAPGGAFYHTPIAKLDGVLARVDYENVGSEGGGSATSEEWLKWIGDSWRVDDPDSRPKTKREAAIDSHVAAMKAAVVAGREPARTNFDDLEEGWHSPTDNQKKLPEEKPKKKRGGPSKKGL